MSARRALIAAGLALGAGLAALFAPLGSPSVVRAQATLAIGQPAPAELSFADAQGRSIALRELVGARKNRPALLMLRVQAAWCGTCQWHAGWTRAMVSAFPDRLRALDLLVADEDNAPPAAEAMAAWRARIGHDVPVDALADARDQFRPLFPSPAPLPRIVLLDGRDLTIRAALANPSPDVLTETIRRELARLGDPPAAAPARTREDGPRMDDRFTRDQWDMIRAMRLPDAPPPDPTNRVADNAAAVALGRALFSDQRLAGTNRSCASCHAPDLLFTNGKDVAAEGVGPGVRNVPSLLVAARARSLMWDGRVDSLWAQATMPFEDPTELGSSRLHVAHAVRDFYAADYEALFGPLPPLDDRRRFPAEGKPGDAAWAAMADADRAAVSRVFADVGKAIAAFERSFRLQPTALDRYAAGDRSALTPDEKDGLAAFFAAGCAQCHHGPRLTDDAFHVLRFPTGHGDGTADRGRIDGIPRLLADEFSAAGPFSDAPRPAARPVAAPSMLGAFRTPSLRGVPLTMPYGHGGGFGGLLSVVEAHRTGGLPSQSRYAAGETEPWAQGFDPLLTPKILTFLRLLRADLAPGASPLGRIPASDGSR